MTTTATPNVAYPSPVMSGGKILAPDGGVYALSEVSPYVTLTATGTAFTGACELAGWLALCPYSAPERMENLL